MCSRCGYLPTSRRRASIPTRTRRCFAGIAADIEAVRFDVGGEKIELPVKLKVHDSVFVPLAKWAMLIAGNYRCVRADDVVPIREAVHGDLAKSREIYNWVVDLCVSLGADAGDMVPFEKYAAAAQSLGTPSSAARALANGAPYIERVDRLVQSVAAQRGRKSADIDQIVLAGGRLAGPQPAQGLIPSIEHRGHRGTAEENPGLCAIRVDACGVSNRYHAVAFPPWFLCVLCVRGF